MLPSPVVSPLVPGPSRAIQFVVELVGPRTVPAAHAAELLRPDWRAAMGHPELWTFRPADTVWQSMTARTDGSYDSIAMAWDLISPVGDLTTASATHLLGLGEEFAKGLGRRAIPLTAPADVPAEIRRLRQAQEELDAGTSTILVSARPWRVADLGKALENLGLTPFEGEWGWFGSSHPEPLFAATPFDAPTTDGLTLGFRLARCPDPNVAIEGLFRTADALGSLGLAAFDEDRRPLSAAMRETLRQGARAASQALESVGLRPGSWAALKAFP